MQHSEFPRRTLLGSSRGSLLLVSAIAGSLVVMLRGGGYLEPLLLLLLRILLLLLRIPLLPLLLILALVVSATASATTTCDEDQRARRDACETELEEAAASYLFTWLHRHLPSSLLRISGLSHDHCTQEVPRRLHTGSPASEKNSSRKLTDQAVSRALVSLRLICELPGSLHERGLALWRSQ